MPGLVRFGNTIGASGMALVLLAAFVMQFARHELPCPLCNLQRIAFVLCGFAFALNLRFGSHPYHYGLGLVAALFGLAVSGRQVLLHIASDTGHYGSAILGLHLYSWSFLIFLATIAGIAFLLLVAGTVSFESHRSSPRHPGPFHGLAKAACYLLVLVTLANAAMSFVQCGPIECPDNPTSYWLIERFFG
ncbi:MAG: disulfide bond formation protein B [Enhydrobacter sp.]|nr:MAG: disulfide bond formation protein B [Enhydrobacter sp.]